MVASQRSVAAALLSFAVGLGGSLALAPGKSGQATAEPPPAATPAGASPDDSDGRIAAWDDPRSDKGVPRPPAAPVAAPSPSVQASSPPRKARKAIVARKANVAPKVRWKRHCRCRAVRVARD